MPNTYKNLGQLNPSATTLTTLYTAPSPTIVSTVSVCNRSATPTTYRLSHAIAAAADNDAQYWAKDAPIGANETVWYTGGITMATTDVLRAYATLATVTFQVWGTQIT